ncbi:flagellin [Roseibium polysiphoniae]|uniref:Flagellin n=1 Tax=Roseibium polysiphoniae TaxID=2571221 RepID=A0ABR9CAU1_9HYPH|nr:flagellin [Roseibium polysiphoniae]MBD8877019.1 flagellin [Roseibium polysiphoniae]
MSSLMTNASAMTALQTLNSTNKSMSEVQSRISTGYRVNGAEDNAAYWSIATTMRSDNMALSAVEDALGLGAATIDVMYTSMESTVDVMNEIKAKVVAASSEGVDRAKIQSDITELQNQLQTIGDSSVFNGENWLSSDVTTVTTAEIVSSFTRAGGSVDIQTTSVDLTAVQLYDSAGGTTGILDQDRGFAALAGITGDGIADFDISALTDADAASIDTLVAGIDAALEDITDAATLLGSVKSRVDLQMDFVSELTDAIDRGVGQLVDADMNEESTRLQALQVQQQLGIQALSIANSNSQNILSLFQ